MDEVRPVMVVHYYDARLRETLCGLRGFEHRSTKHPRGVTCPACAGLLRDRPALGDPDASSGTPPPRGTERAGEHARA